jgi:hypothetical protein
VTASIHFSHGFVAEEKKDAALDAGTDGASTPAGRTRS